jgi:hypothetical protein
MKVTLTRLLIALLLLSCALPESLQAVQRRNIRRAAAAAKDTLLAKDSAIQTSRGRAGPGVDTSGSKKLWMGGFGFSDHEIYERAGYVEIGTNLFFSGKTMFAGNKVNTLGLMLGYALPVRVPLVYSAYRAKLFIHGAQLADSSQRKWSSIYAVASNELIVGKSILFRNAPFEPMPFIGVGFNNGIRMSDMPHQGWTGVETHYFTTWDIGIIIKKQLTVKAYHFSLAFCYSYEQAFDLNAHQDDRLTKQRTVISLIYAY